MSTAVCISDYREKAKEVIQKHAWDYYRSGAGDEFTLKLNKDAFQRLRIRPRFLLDVSKTNTKCNILAINMEMPIGISPTALQKMAHPDGEIANCKAAGNAGSLFILSTLATSSIEEVSQAAPETNKWFQLYIYKNRSLTESLIRRAEAAKFKAIVVTVDAPVFGSRRSDMRNNFSLPPHLRLANFTGEENHFNEELSENGVSGINEYVNSLFDATVTWNDIKWLTMFTKLPIILKGILTKEDALLAYKYGCKGVIVSNHGGRQIDGVPASIEALPEISEAVGNKMIVMMDGGITQGADVFKALALGARMVFIGRPALWALAVNGQQGVENMLELLRKDLEVVMALSGCTDVSSINRNSIVHKSYYSKL